MNTNEIYRHIRGIVPDYVTIVAAAKTRSADEIKAIVDAGISDIAENYVQEAKQIQAELGQVANSVRWHLIGHLQTNKINKALGLFDVIQTVDSVKLANAISKRANVTVPILMEINSGREPQKTGVFPEEVEQAVRDISTFPNVAIKGLMTMGPRFGNPEDARPYFKVTKKLFDRISTFNIPGLEMKVLSMGMSNTYKVAIEEGSNMIRLGTVLFEECESCKRA